MAVTEDQIIALAEDIGTRKLHKLGSKLKFRLSDIKRYKEMNYVHGDVTLDGTREMLMDWRDNSAPREQQKRKLKKALEDAGFRGLAEKHFGVTKKKTAKRKADQPVAGSSLKKCRKTNPKSIVHKKKDLAGNKFSAGTSRDEILKGNLTSVKIVVVEQAEVMNKFAKVKMAVLVKDDGEVRDLYIEDTRAMSELIKEAKKLKVKQQVVFEKVKKGSALNNTLYTEIRPLTSQFEYDKSIFNAYVNPPVMSLQEANRAPQETRMSLEGKIEKVKYHKADKKSKTDRRSQLTLGDGNETVYVSMWRKKLKAARGDKMRITALKKNDRFFHSTPSTKHAKIKKLV